MKTSESQSGINQKPIRNQSETNEKHSGTNKITMKTNQEPIKPIRNQSETNQEPMKTNKEPIRNQSGTN